MVGKGDTGLERTLRRRVRTQRACRRRTRRVTRRQPFRVSNRSLVGSTAETSSLPRRDRCRPRNCHDRCVGAPCPQYSPETSSSHGLLLLLLLLAQRHPAVQGGSAHMFAQEERRIRQPYRICCLRQRRKRRQRTGASASASDATGSVPGIPKLRKELKILRKNRKEVEFPVVKAPPLRAKGHKVRSVAVPCAHGTVPKDAPAKSKSVTRPETPSVKCPLEVPRRARPPDVRRPVYTTCVCTVLQCGSVIR